MTRTHLPKSFVDLPFDAYLPMESVITDVRAAPSLGGVPSSGQSARGRHYLFRAEPFGAAIGAFYVLQIPS